VKIDELYFPADLVDSQLVVRLEGEGRNEREAVAALMELRIADENSIDYGEGRHEVEFEGKRCQAICLDRGVNPTRIEIAVSEEKKRVGCLLGWLFR